jgi:hypothetical protein
MVTLCPFVGTVPANDGAGLTGHVDATVLAGRVRAVRVERETAENRAVGWPGPRPRSPGQDGCTDQDDEKDSPHGPHLVVESENHTRVAVAAAVVNFDDG